MRFFLILLISLSSGIFSSPGEKTVIYAFRDGNSISGQRMVIVGETVSYDKASVLESDTQTLYDIGLDTRPDTVTIQLLYPDGVRRGQTLYLIEKNPDHTVSKQGNIVGEVVVKSIFDTAFFGTQIRAVGYLNIVKNKRLTVVRPLETDNQTKSMVASSKALYYSKKGKTAEAIQHYKDAISLDPKNPVPHFRLAKLYQEDVEASEILAGEELLQAYNNRSRFPNMGEQLDFLVAYTNYLNQKFQLYESKDMRTFKSLRAARNAYAEGMKIQPDYFELLVAASNTELLLLQSIREENTTSSRQAKLQISNKLQELLEKGLAKQPLDYRIQRVASLFYYEKWRELSKGGPAEMREAKDAREQIEKHGKLYIQFKPKTVEGDNSVIEAMKISEASL